VLAVLAGFVVLPGLPVGVAATTAVEAATAVEAPMAVEAPDPVPVPPDDVAPGASYAWPLAPPPAVLTPFRAPEHPFGPGHRGVDLAGTLGQPVHAARDGMVVFAGQLAGRGVVSVQHPDGLRTTYEPVLPSVVAGARVGRGEPVGLLQAGHPGCAAVCLHWGVRRDRLEYLDPLALLRPPRVRLLPVPDPWPG
jgi:murein DD-endopeptidase MepM/ murein hydrolase activator NlpD